MCLFGLEYKTTNILGNLSHSPPYGRQDSARSFLISQFIRTNTPLTQIKIIKIPMPPKKGSQNLGYDVHAGSDSDSLL